MKINVDEMQVLIEDVKAVEEAINGPFSIQGGSKIILHRSGLADNGDVVDDHTRITLSWDEIKYPNMIVEFEPVVKETEVKPKRSKSRAKVDPK